MDMNKAYLRLVDVDGGLRLVEGCVLYPPQQGPEIVDVDAAKLPEGFWEDWWGGKWAYADGAVVLSGIEKPEEPEPGTSIDERLAALETESRMLHVQNGALVGWCEALEDTMVEMITTLVP